MRAKYQSRLLQDISSEIGEVTFQLEQLTWGLEKSLEALEGIILSLGGPNPSENRNLVSVLNELTKQTIYPYNYQTPVTIKLMKGLRDIGFSVLLSAAAIIVTIIYVF